MIISKCFDVEIFPNLFSVSFVDLRSYLSVFADCVDENNKPIATTDKLTVKEIKDRLEKVDKKVFYISDTDDSQLLELVSYINNMQSHYDTEEIDGQLVQTPVRYDLYGYNILAYDNYMIKAFMMHFNRFDTTKELIKYLYNLSKDIISLQDDKQAFFNNKKLELLSHYRLPYASVDLFKVYALNSASVNIDKDSGTRIKLGKSLKQTSINLKWYELLEFKLPPIDDEEIELYWSKQNAYKGLSKEEVNKLVTNDFDRYVLPKYVNDMLHYNMNDVFIVAEIVRQKPDEVKLRYSLSSAFKLNLLSSSRANIADKLLVKFYSEMSGLHESKFEKLKTERTRLSFNKVIFPHIKFKTKQLQDLLTELMQVYIYHVNKDSFCREFEFYGTKYTLATGGLHTQDYPAIFKSNDKYTYVHHDYTSYYPSIMIAYNIHPQHLNDTVFNKMVKYFKDTRVECKHTKDEVKQVITGVPNKTSAEALKIVINAIYGKFGSDVYWLYDRLAQLKVTINGQLMTMTLVEALELAGIHVVSANTDGLVLKIPNDKFDEYDKIVKEWNELNKMSADDEHYKILIRRDVNNYIDIQSDDTIEYKGALDPKQYIKDLKKGYDMPIVAKAVYEYFINNVPVMETLRNSTNILDFCKTQNVGKQFDVVYDKVINGKVVSIYSQRNIRFYVSTKGVIVSKENKLTKHRSKLASGLPVIILNTLDDESIENRCINYGYYKDRCYDIINPIKLQISPNQKSDTVHGISGGKRLIRKLGYQFNDLFNEDE